MSIINELSEIIDVAREDCIEIPRGNNAFAENSIVCRDNLEYIASCAGGPVKLDFIYIDPPFFTGSTYNARLKDTDGASQAFAYSDKWSSMSDFLRSLSERLILMREVLKDSGSIAVHLDTRAVHYVKILMDEIFGSKNFVNELIWSYKSGGASIHSFAKKHDTILLYSKTPKYYFSPQKERSYNRQGKPYRFKGVEEFEDEEGRWYTMVNRRDILSVDMVGRTSAERTGYATQKPEKLLEILIQSCCPEDGICADFFCGSGTLGAAAKKLGRRYVLCDQSELAVEISRNRLADKDTEEQISFL